jgi:hypothetical protein
MKPQNLCKLQGYRIVACKLFLLALICFLSVSCGSNAVNDMGQGGDDGGAGSGDSTHIALWDTIDIATVMKSVTGGRQSLGVNYNGQFNRLDFVDLQRTKTKWVRGFAKFFKLYKGQKNDHPIKTKQNIKFYLKLKDRGYKTILNIKWNFHNKDFPSNNSTEMRHYKKFLTKLLDVVWNKTDILVIGNEPFIESKKSERGIQLVQFYERIAKFIKQYETKLFKEKQSDSSKKSKDYKAIKPIYIGAFNNLYLNSWQTNAVNRLLKFAESSPWIAGIDLHIHHNRLKQLGEALNYVTNRIRDDQKIIITEFSVVKYFKKFMTQTIPSSFANKFGYPARLKNYEYIDKALKKSVSRKEWVSYLRNSSWFESKKKYILNAFNLFKSHEKFSIATYGLRQSYPPNKDFTSNTMPWVLNSIYANRTVQPDSAGQNQFNYAWIRDFWAAQDYSNNH